MPTAIVTDGMWRKSLSAVRALGKAGYDVHVLGDSVLTTSFWSRYTSGRHIFPTAASSSSEFGRGLFGLIRSLSERPVLVPMEDATVEWLSVNSREATQFCDFIIPAAESIKIARSKTDTLKIADKLGIKVPETYSFPTHFELGKFLNSLSTFEMEKYLIKPVSGSGSSGIIYSRKLEGVEIERHWRLHGPLIVQKRLPIEGRAIGVSIFFDKAGELVASFAHERLQQYPNSGGPSTSRISIVSPELSKKSIELLSQLNWRGVAMVEWKLDEDDTPYLLEINGRFWGSLELSIRSGVNFPLLYAEAAAGRNCFFGNSYTAGVLCKWMFPGELLRYLTQERSKREDIKTFFKGFPNDSEEWDVNDWPGFVSSFICPAVSIIKPRYWKYIMRR